MPTIAHEGNPRSTPTLAVSGVFDGTVTLNLTFPTDDIRSNPIPIILPQTDVLPSALDKYEITDFVFGVNYQTFNHIPGSPSTIITPQGNIKEFSNGPRYGFVRCRAAFDYSFNTNSLKPVVRVQQPFEQLLADQRQFGYPSFGEVDETVMIRVIDGLNFPRIGLALAVRPDSIPDEFYGVVAVVDYGAETLGIYNYQGESLRDLIEPVTEIAATLSIGDYFVATVTRGNPVDPTAGDSFGAFIFDSVGNLLFGLGTSPNQIQGYLGEENSVAVVDIGTDSHELDWIKWDNANVFISQAVV